MLQVTISAERSETQHDFKRIYYTDQPLVQLDTLELRGAASQETIEKVYHKHSDVLFLMMTPEFYPRLRPNHIAFSAFSPLQGNLTLRINEILIEGGHVQVPAGTYSLAIRNKDSDHELKFLLEVREVPDLLARPAAYASYKIARRIGNDSPRVFLINFYNTTVLASTVALSNLNVYFHTLKYGSAIVTQKYSNTARYWSIFYMTGVAGSGVVGAVGSGDGVGFGMVVGVASPMIDFPYRTPPRQFMERRREEMLILVISI